MFPETIGKIHNTVTNILHICAGKFQLKITDVNWIADAIYLRAYQIAKEDYYRKTGRDMRHWNPNFRALIKNSVQRQITQYL